MRIVNRIMCTKKEPENLPEPHAYRIIHKIYPEVRERKERLNSLQDQLIPLFHFLDSTKCYDRLQHAFWAVVSRLRSNEQRLELLSTLVSLQTVMIGLSIIPLHTAVEQEAYSHSRPVPLQCSQWKQVWSIAAILPTFRHTHCKGDHTLPLRQCNPHKKNMSSKQRLESF